MTPNKISSWHHRFNNKFDKKSEVQKVQYRKKLILNYEKFNYVSNNKSICTSFILETKKKLLKKNRKSYIF